MQWQPGHVSFPRFDEENYISMNPDAREAIQRGLADSAVDHYIRYGLDEQRHPLIRRDPVALQGSVDRFFVSDSGYFLLMGWIADEGTDLPQYKLLGSEFNFNIPSDCIYRHARPDVEGEIKKSAYDYGFVAFGKSPSKSLLKQTLLLQINALAGTFQTRTIPELISDKRMLDTVLGFVATSQSHAGKETGLNYFLTGSAGPALVELFQIHVASASSGYHVERFGKRSVKHSFVTVLFGSTDPLQFQPLLFRAQKIDFGEWIFVCNSPELATATTRIGRLVSDLYDVVVTIILVRDNIGFGAANNMAISNASSNSIYIINPDIFPMESHSALLREALEADDLGDNLRGGLLFYDDKNLMHSGMYFDTDLFFRTGSHSRKSDAPAALKLARVEHFDKGVPFHADKWTSLKAVPAITGAVMGFDRQYFERLGGFSTRYIYGHYEDADLSVRWADVNGPVVVDPRIRLVHLEGQGSKVHGDQYRGAAIVNRHLFTLQHSERLDRK